MNYHVLVVEGQTTGARVSNSDQQCENDDNEYPIRSRQTQIRRVDWSAQNVAVGKVRLDRSGSLTHAAECMRSFSPSLVLCPLYVSPRAALACGCMQSGVPIKPLLAWRVFLRLYLRLSIENAEFRHYQAQLRSNSSWRVYQQERFHLH